MKYLIKKKKSYELKIFGISRNSKYKIINDKHIKQKILK